MTGTTWRPDVLADFEHKVIGAPLISAPIHITVRKR